jgi:hypothetical protein
MILISFQHYDTTRETDHIILAGHYNIMMQYYDTPEPDHIMLADMIAKYEVGMLNSHWTALLHPVAC